MFVSFLYIQLTRSSYSKLAFLTRNSLFLLKIAFLTRNSLFVTRNSLFLLETRFSYSKLAFLTRNSLFLLETHFSYSKLAFLTRNSLFLLETHYLLKVNQILLSLSLTKYRLLLKVTKRGRSGIDTQSSIHI